MLKRCFRSMHSKKKLNCAKLKHYLRQVDIKDELFNELFYCSIFDSSSVFEGPDEEYWPIDEVQKFRINTLRLVKKLLNRKDYPEIQSLNIDNFSEFDKQVISTDFLCRILLQRKLSSMGVKCSLSSDPKMDLIIENPKYLIELKRICLWTNYANYFESFINKVDRYVWRWPGSPRYLYVITYHFPFAINNILAQIEKSHLMEDYIHKIVKSHYALERIEKLIKGKHINCVIHYIDDSGNAANTLSSLCEEIKNKIEGGV
jgi:hypothetical protein